MRTTVTLDPDVRALLERAMQERGVSFKEAVNDAIRRSLAKRPPARFSTPTFPMGSNPEVDLTKALRLAAALEDEELIRKLAAGK